jgi:TolA-binding protein
MASKTALITGCFAALAAVLVSCAGPKKTVPGKAAPKDKAAAADSVQALYTPAVPARDPLAPHEAAKLSKATRLLLQAVDNYIEILPTNKKIPEIMMLKGHTYYNNQLYRRAREAYQNVIKKHEKSEEVPEAIKMTAQIYYEENEFDKAQEWYQKLKESAKTGADKEEASVRLAESYYRIGERHRRVGRLDRAIEAFEQVLAEFPKSKIADAALLNIGNLYLDQKAWTKAILTYNKMMAAYPKSRLLEKAFFNMAKCYEQMGNWSKAALTYVEIFKRFPASENIKDALYNAGLAYEKQENYVLATKAFEKYAATWPDQPDAPDVLFRAGELYGKMEDWANVEKINSLFGRRYGQDKERIVMALCMTGVASNMQKKHDQALVEFQKAIDACKNVGSANKANAFYAAKAQHTIGLIHQDKANKVALKLPESVYQANLKQKIQHMEAAVEAYTAVSAYKLLEWTSQALYRLGETYEQFGGALYRRERPKRMNLQKTLSFEEGVAQVVEEYFAKRALVAHEQNVKFGIQYKYEDDWIKRSNQQLTKLPYLAGAAYAKLIQLANILPATTDTTNPMKLIQHKLELLQNVAPFQSKAIELFIKTIEMGAKYGVKDKYPSMASPEITRMSYEVGNTYAQVAAVARGAPIPGTYDPYTRFFYRVQLLNEGLVEYENKAVSALFQNIKIAEAYKIEDKWVRQSKGKISEILFNRSFCFEILAEEALRRPPVPADASEDEKEEYLVQFEELSYKLQDKAFGIYRVMH